VSPENDRLVIEGLVTNEVKPFTVKLSKTLPLGDGGSYPVVNNAFITISDNAGNLDTLPLVGNGVYQTNGPRQGVVGRTYLVTVVVDGTTYVGQDILTQVPAIDSVAAIYREKGDELGITENGYYVYYIFEDPAGEKNYYMEAAYNNGLAVLKSNQLNLFTDQFIKPGVPFITRAEGRYKVGDKVKVTLSSLSETGYNFMNGVLLQLQNDGGFFSTPPANAPNNLSGGALGFFRASSVSVDSLVVTQ